MSRRTPAHRSVRGIALLLLLLVLTPGRAPAQQADFDALSRQVEIRRTAYGVPHIRGQTLRAAYYALGYAQVEDYGAPVALGLLRARGEYGRFFGRDSMETDFIAQRVHRIAVDRYPSLDPATRDAYEGFAAGVNRYIATHPQEFPTGFDPRFTGHDVAARDINQVTPAQARRFLARVGAGSRGAQRGGTSEGEGPVPATDAADRIDEGSNAWAFHPSRTKSGKAILVRNPHLSWSAGYYEAHMTVPGVLDFYGDFRVGGPFGVIGGFNRHLGWSTTNNAADNDEIYALDVDSLRADHYLFDGASLPLERELVTVAYRNGPGLSTETRESWRSHLGPVLLRDGGKVYVLKAGSPEGHRAGEQFLRMMRARSLEEWKEAMRMRAYVESNFTYADRAGNIFYVWNGAVPDLPHPSGGDTVAVPAGGMGDVWTRLIPWDSLPQLQNPPGGYVHNENDAPWYANLRAVLDHTKYPPYLEPPRLRLRSQLSLELIDNDRKLSLEEVMALKNSYRMLLADRVKADLIAAVRASEPTGSVADAITTLERWDNTAAHEARGAVLFQAWWQRYTDGADSDTMYAEPWDTHRPTATPRGLGDAARAVEAFRWAVDATVRQHGRADVAWGEVHRVRHGDVDAPVGGCGGALGCFRALNFRTDPDGRRSVIGGDGWVIGVEFGEVPRAYSILAYGQSAKPDSPHHDDQAAMFAAGEYKRVVFAERDIEAATVRRYRP